MHRVARYWALLMMLALLSRPGFSSTEPSEQIRLRVYNYAHVPARVLAKSKDVAARILREAGVSTVWIDCPLTNGERPLFPGCQQPFTPTDLTLNFIPSNMMQAQSESREAFGMAMLSDQAGHGSIAYVFYEPISRMATEQGLNPGALAGHIVAHEIGHLLLGGNQHSRTGIMTAHWFSKNVKATERGNLLFSAEEAERMAANIVRRNR